MRAAEVASSQIASDIHPQCTHYAGNRVFSIVGFVLLAGVYKPRVRCYDVAQMSMKFERCMDSEVIRFLLLADDYTKAAFLIL